MGFCLALTGGQWPETATSSGRPPSSFLRELAAVRQTATQAVFSRLVFVKLSFVRANLGGWAL
jgi:hypothetical protein